MTTNHQKQRLEAAVQEGQEAFWATIAANYPEATTGDLDPDAANRLQEAMREAARTWIAWNVPDSQGGSPEAVLSDLGFTEAELGGGTTGWTRELGDGRRWIVTFDRTRAHGDPKDPQWQLGLEGEEPDQHVTIGPSTLAPIAVALQPAAELAAFDHRAYPTLHDRSFPTVFDMLREAGETDHPLMAEAAKGDGR